MFGRSREGMRYPPPRSYAVNAGTVSKWSVWPLSVSFDPVGTSGPSFTPQPSLLVAAFAGQSSPRSLAWLDIPSATHSVAPSDHSPLTLLLPRR